MILLYKKNIACVIVMSVVLAIGEAKAAYIDAQNLVSLTVSKTPSSAAGHVAWRFGVASLDAANEISSIDAVTGEFGFSGSAFRQVNPSGQPTVFSDFNGQFGAGEDATTDTQFTYFRSSLTVAPGTEVEGNTKLEAAFTGFSPILLSDGDVTFAQIVTPEGIGGQFQGGFVVRPVGGGLPQLVEFGPISFGFTPGDFNADGDVDGTDLSIWESSYGVGAGADADVDGDSDGADFLDWQRGFGSPGTPGSGSSQIVPEPSSAGLLILGILGFRCRNS
jgi:hypothetical protein